MSLKEGKFTAKDQYNYRSSHDARIAFGVVNEKTMMLPSDDFTFGKPNRVQTPVVGIISNLYGEKAGDQLQKRHILQHEMVRYKQSLSLLQ